MIDDCLAKLIEYVFKQNAFPKSTKEGILNFIKLRYALFQKKKQPFYNYDNIANYFAKKQDIQCKLSTSKSQRRDAHKMHKCSLVFAVHI